MDERDYMYGSYYQSTPPMMQNPFIIPNQNYMMPNYQNNNSSCSCQNKQNNNSDSNDLSLLYNITNRINNLEKRVSRLEKTNNLFDDDNNMYII